MLPVGAGLTFHPALLSYALQHPPSFIEIIAESAASSSGLKQARALAEVAPMSVHGVSLSLGSADGVDDARLRALKRVVDATGAVAVSEHLSFVRAGGREIGHLTPLPRTMATVDVIGKNVDTTQRALRRPLLLENVWSPLAPGYLMDGFDEMSEAEFLCAVVDKTGCGLLLDVANLWANEKNRGGDAIALLDALPLQAVREVHIAGSAQDDDGFTIDTHADAINDEVFALLDALLARTGPLPVCLERDRNIDVENVAQELRSIAEIITHHSYPNLGEGRRPAPARPSALGAKGLQAWQACLARALTDDVNHDAQLARARGILARKSEEHRRHRAQRPSLWRALRSHLSRPRWSPL